MRLVLIDWVDSFGCASHWEEITSELKPTLLKCRSVGWLAYEDADCVVIVPHVADVVAEKRKDGCGDMTIPKRAILKIRELSIGDVVLPVADEVGQ